MIIGGLIGAAGSIGGAAVNSSSASNAANAQVQAANTAAQTQLSMYNQTRQDLSPWMNTGGAANAQLAYLYGLGPQPGTAGAGGYALPGSPGTYNSGNLPPGYMTTPINSSGTGGGIYQIGPNGQPIAGSQTSPPGYAAAAAGAGGGATGVPNYSAMLTALENTPGYQFTQQQGVQALDRSAASQGLLLSGGQQKAVTGYGQNLAVTNAWQPYINQLNQMSTAGQNSAAKTGELGSAAAGNIGSAQLAAGSAAASGAYNTGTALTSGINGVSGYLQSMYGSSYGNPGGQNFLTSASDTTVPF
jgi:hypothetical protein